MEQRQADLLHRTNDLKEPSKDEKLTTRMERTCRTVPSSADAWEPPQPSTAPPSWVRASERVTYACLRTDA